MLTIASGTVFPSRPGGRPARWAATGRLGGVSQPPYDSLNLAWHVGDEPAHVAVNMDRLAASIGCAAGQWAVPDAVHGATVAVVDGPGRVEGVDAIVTDRPGLALVALAADCVPVVLVGDDDRTVAVVHCGWRGLVADVVGATVSVLRERGADVARAVLGPSVCGGCYPVPPERAAAVRASCPEPVWSAALLQCADGQPGIDVARGVRAQLDVLGVPPQVVEVVPGCTVEDPALFSHRRDGVTGRQGVVVARMDP